MAFQNTSRKWSNKEGKKATRKPSRCRRYVPDLLSKDFQVRSAGERAAVNSPIQGSAADIIKLAMIRLEQKLEKTRSRPSSNP